MFTKSLYGFWVVGACFMLIVWGVLLKFPIIRHWVRSHKAYTFLLLELAQAAFHGIGTVSQIALNFGGSILNGVILGPWAVYDRFCS